MYRAYSASASVSDGVDGRLLDAATACSKVKLAEDEKGAADTPKGGARRLTSERASKREEGKSTRRDLEHSCDIFVCFFGLSLCVVLRPCELLSLLCGIELFQCGCLSPAVVVLVYVPSACALASGLLVAVTLSGAGVEGAGSWV